MPEKKSSPLASLITGCIAGGIECVTVWPMEYIKTQLQLQVDHSGTATTSIYTNMV
jgi:hypothetical protein